MSKLFPRFERIVITIIVPAQPASEASRPSGAQPPAKPDIKPALRIFGMDCVSILSVKKLQ